MDCELCLGVPERPICHITPQEKATNGMHQAKAQLAMKHHRRISLGLHGLLVLCAAATMVGCKKKPPPARPGIVQPDPNSVVCPPIERIVHAVEQDQKGRAVRASCVVFAPGYYWLGAAVSYDPKTKGDVRVHMISGGQSPRISDVDPLPAAALAELVKNSDDVEARIRRGSDNRLVRMGVLGRRKNQQPEAEEIGMVLQLKAHAPPLLIWIGQGDQSSTQDGCHLERSVDFEMPFGNRLEMITTTRAKGTGAGCKSSPGSQEQIETKGLALKAGRTLAGL
jgi:hypothetical protein